MGLPKGPRVMVDTSLLLIARTGIRTYILELAEGVQGHPQLRANYVLPGFKWFRQIILFHGKMSLIKKLLFHSFYFIWKHLAIPTLAIARGANIIVMPDYIAPILPTGKLVVIVFHDVFYWEHRDSYHPVWRRWMLSLVNLGIRANRHRVVATSQHTAGKIRRYLPGRDAITVIYQCPRSVPEMEVEVQPEANYFLHVGTLERRKNLEVLVRAYSLFRQSSSARSKLVLVGGPSPSALLDVEKDLLELIKALDLQGEVIMTGYVSETKIPSYYRQASAYVFPSLDEGFGIPLVEAMRHGVPTIISPAGSLPEISDGASLIWDDGRVDTLALLMDQLQDEEVSHELSKKGLKRAARFSRSQFVKDFDDFLKENG